MTFPLLGYMAVYAYGLPVLAGGIRYTRLHRRDKVFYLFCVFNVIGVVTEDILSEYNYHNHLFINIFRLMEITFLSVLFYLWFERKQFKTLSRIAPVVFGATWIVTNILFHFTAPFNTIDATLANAIRIILSSALLFELIYSHDHPFIQDKLFWIALGIFMYNSIFIIILMLSNWLLQQGMSYFYIAWHVNWSLSILCNILFSLSFFIQRP